MVFQTTSVQKAKARFRSLETQSCNKGQLLPWRSVYEDTYTYKKGRIILYFLAP